MKKYLLILYFIIIFIILTGSNTKKEDLIKRRILIMPVFNTSSNEEYDYLSDVIWDTLKLNMKKKGDLEIVDYNKIKNEIKNQRLNKLDCTRLEKVKDLALTLGADIILISMYDIKNDEDIIIKCISYDLLKDDVSITSLYNGCIGLEVYRYIDEVSIDLSNKMKKKFKLIERKKFEQIIENRYGKEKLEAFIRYKSIGKNIPMQGLIGEYLFNNDQSDTSINNNLGINNNAVYVNDRFENDKSALFFNGSDSYLKVPNTNLKSISVWINVNNNEQVGILSSGIIDDNDLDLEMYLYKPGGIGGSVSDKEINDNYGLYFILFWYYDLVIPFNEIIKGWHHIILTWDGYNKINIYIDGKAKDIYMFDGSQWIFYEKNKLVLNYIPNPSKQVDSLIGMCRFPGWDQGSQYFSGKIDDLRFYNRVINDKEVMQLFKESN